MPQKRILIVRLDAIGDYIFFRNSLRFIRQSVCYRDAHITLLGNPAWKSIAETYDRDCADEWLWLTDRPLYFKTSAENVLPEFIWHPRVRRKQAELRQRLKALRFDEVISPQCSRNPLLDELLGDIAPETVGAKGTGGVDAVYTHLLCTGDRPFMFFKNRQFASALTKERCEVSFTLGTDVNRTCGNTVILAIGASHWTKRWPISHWIALGRALLDNTDSALTVAGGRDDSTRARKIVQALRSDRVTSIAGCSLPDFIAHAASAKAAVSNDTGTLHIAAALGLPYVIAVVNGNTGRDAFWPYPEEMKNHLHVCQPSFIRPAAGPLFLRQLANYRNICDVTPGAVLSALLPGK
jgi:ADP-heptose:LPS heptosyltransferase